MPRGLSHKCREEQRMKELELKECGSFWHLVFPGPGFFLQANTFWKSGMCKQWLEGASEGTKGLSASVNGPMLEILDEKVGFRFFLLSFFSFLSLSIHSASVWGISPLFLMVLSKAHQPGGLNGVFQTRFFFAYIFRLLFSQKRTCSELCSLGLQFGLFLQ